MIVIASIVVSLISTAIAFDKERNVVAWYVVALVLPMLAYALTDAMGVGLLAAALPVALLALEPQTAKSHAVTSRKTVTA